VFAVAAFLSALTPKCARLLDVVPSSKVTITIAPAARRWGTWCESHVSPAEIAHECMSWQMFGVMNVNGASAGRVDGYGTSFVLHEPLGP
jgi:hypothetical protein